VVLGTCGPMSEAFEAYGAPEIPEYFYEAMRIGHARYGTLGPGSGMPGGIRLPNVPVPTVKLGPITITPPDPEGESKKLLTRRFIKRNIQKVTYCYEKRLTEDPDIAGALDLNFTVNADGHVKAAPVFAEPFDAAIAKCVAEVVVAIEFPKPAQEYAAVVPLVFESPAAEQRRTRERLQSARRARNPLGENMAALQTCTGSGVGVARFWFQPDGSVKETLFFGSDAPCVKAAAEHARNTSQSDAMQCGFAFGTQSPEDIKTLAITDTEYRWEGAPLPDSELPAAIDSVIVRHPSDLFAAFGPFAIEVEPSVRMSRVLPVLYEAYSHGADVVFVVPGAFGGKRFLGGHELPMPPRRAVQRTSPSHAVHVGPQGLMLDGAPIRDEVALVAKLAALRPSITPRIDVTFGDVTFGQYARIVDLAADAGFSEWEP